MVSKFIRNDYGFVLTFTITDTTGTALVLTDSTITFKAKMKTGGVTVSGACVITDAIGGICQYTVQATDFVTSGIYSAELQIVFTSKTISAKVDDIWVLDDL